jgi:hypothetical protein
MEPEGSVPRQKQPWVRSELPTPSHSYRILVWTSHLRLCLPNSLFPWRFFTKFVIACDRQTDRQTILVTLLTLTRRSWCVPCEPRVGTCGARRLLISGQQTYIKRTSLKYRVINTADSHKNCSMYLLLAEMRCQCQGLAVWTGSTAADWTRQWRLGYWRVGKKGAILYR